MGKWGPLLARGEPSPQRSLSQFVPSAAVLTMGLAGKAPNRWRAVPKPASKRDPGLNMPAAEGMMGKQVTTTVAVARALPTLMVTLAGG